MKKILILLILAIFFISAFLGINIILDYTDTGISPVQGHSIGSHEPEYEWLNVEGCSYWNDFFISRNVLYLFAPSKYDDWSETSENTTGRIYLYNLSDLSEPLLTLKHNFGHCNTVHYCEQTDRILIGNLPGNKMYPAALYIIDNVSSWISLNNESFLDFKQIEHTIIDLGELNNIFTHVGDIAACWGANNLDNYDCVWISSHYNRDWFKLLLGTGKNDLSVKKDGGGTFSLASEDQFNGTYLTLEHYTFEAEHHNKYSEVIQGIDYENGKIYTSNGHDQMLGAIWDFKDNTVQRKVIKNSVHHPNGSTYSSMSEGFCIYEGYAYHGYTEAQRDNKWNNSPQRKENRIHGIMKYKIPY